METASDLVTPVPALPAPQVQDRLADIARRAAGARRRLTGAPGAAVLEIIPGKGYRRRPGLPEDTPKGNRNENANDSIILQRALADRKAALLPHHLRTVE